MRIVNFIDDPIARGEQMVTREWLVTAGNGSYACGTLGFVPTRRHHGLLIANQPAPQGRTLSLVGLRDEVLSMAPTSHPKKLWGVETTRDGLTIHGSEYLVTFLLDCGFPVWTYEINGICIEKSIVMPHESKSVCIRYRVKGQQSARLELRPMIQFRGHNDSVATPCATTCQATDDGRYEFASDSSANVLRVKIFGNASEFVQKPISQPNCFYRIEQARGYDHVGDLASAGYFTIEAGKESEFLFVASMDSWDRIDSFENQCPFQSERSRRESLLNRANSGDPSGVKAELVLAADQFLMTPAKRAVDEPDSGPTTAEPQRRSIIAGYPWFTDWGRDTMISLPGLTLATGRFDEARQILLTFADYVRDGLIPNLFPEGGQEGMYHTADATLWFFQAIAEYERATGDEGLVVQLLPKLTEIIEAHVHGTRFGIHMDQKDGLLVQGQHDVQLTWMDAKAGDWVVTPRRGKAVEINALWYNALHLYCDWIERFDRQKKIELRKILQQTQQSFNKRFWIEDGGYLYDVVDGDQGDDDSLRPNQLFAISLLHPVLDESRWPAVMQSCLDHLLTPVGLRSLARKSENYIGVYYGDVYKRDAAYHQGTVWSWLIGPMVKAWCRTHPDQKQQAVSWLNGLDEHLGEGCIGQVSEIFAGDPPHEPKGCFAQAWGVAEMLEARRAIDYVQ